MLASIQRALLWDKALQSVYKKRFTETLEALDALLKEPPVQNQIHAEVKTMRLYALARLGRRAAVLAEIDDALATASSRRQEHDRKYILAAIKTIGSSAYLDCHGEESPVPSKFEVDWAQVDLSKTPSRLKRMFPLIAHPNWK
jgi:hypothetical protein